MAALHIGGSGLVPVTLWLFAYPLALLTAGLLLLAVAEVVRNDK